MTDKFMGSKKFYKILKTLSFTALDVGARRGINADLIEIAPFTNYYGFEPDKEECKKLNNQKSHASPWREINYIPTALGEKTEKRTLYLYRRRGCSSLLKANLPLVKQFGREKWYEVAEKATVQTEPLDSLSAEDQLSNVDYIKLDTQGTELEILRGAKQKLSDEILAIRTEVSFIPIYQNQVLFSELDEHLQSFDFLPMDFEELHSWRRNTSCKPKFSSGGPYPFSKGQIVHGDVLYFRDITQMTVNEISSEKKLKLFFLALAHGHLDYAIMIYEKNKKAFIAQTKTELNWKKEISRISKRLARKRILNIPNEIWSFSKQWIYNRWLT